MTGDLSFTKKAGGPSLLLINLSLLSGHQLRTLRKKKMLLEQMKQTPACFSFLVWIQILIHCLWNVPKVIICLQLTMFPSGAQSFISKSFWYCKFRKHWFFCYQRTGKGSSILGWEDLRWDTPLLVYIPWQKNEMEISSDVKRTFKDSKRERKARAPYTGQSG